MNIYSEGVFGSDSKNMKFKEYLNNESGNKVNGDDSSRYEDIQNVRETVRFMNNKLWLMNDGKSMEIEDMFSSEYKKVMNNVEVYGRLIESMERKD